MTQQLEGESNEHDANVTIEYQQYRDTTDFFKLQVSHHLAFEDVHEAVNKKEQSLKRYALRPNHNKAWLDGEIELLDSIKGYVLIVEELVDELDKKKKESDELTIEAYNILSQAEQLTSNATW